MSKIKDLYRQIWDERPHRCSNCGYPLREPIAHVFAHIKSKGAHPDLKYDPDNIRLLCSGWIRNDDKAGCHELEHTNPEKFRQRSTPNPLSSPVCCERQAGFSTCLSPPGSRYLGVEVLAS